MLHTPGPWIHTPWKHGKDSVLNEIAIHSEFGQWIADTVIDQDCESANVENMIANAKLIAAAPELLEAITGLFEHCAMIHKHWGDADNRQQADAAIATARATIAKATE